MLKSLHKIFSTEDTKQTMEPHVLCEVSQVTGEAAGKEKLLQGLARPGIVK